VNAAEAEVRSAEPVFVQPKVVEVDVNAYAKVDCGEPLERGQRAEGHGVVFLAIDRDDVFGAAAQQLIDGKFSMWPSIRQVD